MAGDPLDALRLSVMQEVLPVGVALVERARRGGVRDVMAVFEGSNPADSLGRLKEEGEPVASRLRETLDRVQPGLGNPVVKVEVRDVVDAEAPAGSAAAAPATTASPSPDERADLQATLSRIGARLSELERRLG